MKSTPYSILERPALRVTGPDRQYALGETYGGYYSLRWTTSLPVARVFHEFSLHVDLGHPFDVHVDTKRQRNSFSYEGDSAQRGPDATLDAARAYARTPRSHSPRY